MDLNRRDVEYVYPDLTSIPADPELTVTFDDGLSWHPLTVDDDGAARALVAGPDATDVLAGAVVLPLGRSVMAVRSVSTPERLHRHVGVIDVR